MSDAQKDTGAMPEGAVELQTAGRFMKWENHGDSVTGVLLRLELSKKYADKDKAANFIAIIRTDNGERVAVSAVLKIKQAVEDYDLLGKRVHIIYSGDTETKGGTVKEFRIGLLPPLRTEKEDDLPF